MVKKIEEIVKPSKGLEPTEHTTTELPPDTPTKILQGQKEIKFTLEGVIPSLERNFDIMNALSKGINDLELSLNHKVASLKVDLLEKINTLRDELLKKTDVDPSTLTETTTETKSTPETYENVDTTEGKVFMTLDELSAECYNATEFKRIFFKYKYTKKYSLRG